MFWSTAFFNKTIYLPCFFASLIFKKINKQNIGHPLTYLNLKVAPYNMIIM